MINELLKTKKDIRFRNGKLKIAVFSDLHGRTEYDRQPIADLEKAVNAVKPDLVILCGDQVGGKCGFESVEELGEYLAEINSVMEKQGIPWAHVFGNHDGQGGAKEVQQKIYEGFEYCLSKAGPEDIYGVGNYFLPVKASEGDEVVFGVWGLDSHEDIRGRHPWLSGKDIILPNGFGCTTYDSVSVDQAAWYYDSSVALEEHFGRKIPSLMCFHIPVPEYQLIVRNPERTGMTGEAREAVAASEHNSGLFAAALLRADVLAMCCGHEHINDFCGEYCGIKLCYDGGLCHSENSYWQADMLGGRIFEIEESDPRSLKTYMFKLAEA